MSHIKPTKINQSSISKAVSSSSRIEGLSFDRAKSNSKAIQLLKKHGRAFSI
jgi:hypothetical protein